MQRLAEQQRMKQDAEYRAKQLNQAKMNQIIANQSQLETQNKEMIKNDRVEMMQQNNIDPKVIEAARIRMENSDDESESDDSVVIEKQQARDQNQNARVDIVDKVFHGRPLMLKPPINPYSFNSYHHIPQIQQEVKKPKKKKKKAPPPQSSHEALLKQLLEAQLRPNQTQSLPIFNPGINHDALDRLQRQMAAQNGMIREINSHVMKLKKDKDQLKSHKKEQVLKLEQQFDEYDRYHRIRRNVDHLKDQIQSESNASGINRLRAAHAEEKMLDELKNQIEEVRLERSQKFRNIGSQSLKNFSHQAYHNQDKEISSQTEPKKRKKRSKKSKINIEEARDKIQDIADEIVKKELEKRNQLKEEKQTSQPSQILNPASKANPTDPGKDFIQTQQGLTIIPSSDPYKPPIVILPKKDKERLVSSKSKKSSKDTNPFDDYMNTLIKMEMMRQERQFQARTEPFDPWIIPLVDDLSDHEPQEKIKNRQAENKDTQIGYEIKVPSTKEPMQNQLFQVQPGEKIAQEPLILPQKVAIQPPPLMDDQVVEIDPPKKQPNRLTSPKPRKNEGANKFIESSHIKL